MIKLMQFYGSRIFVSILITGCIQIETKVSGIVGVNPTPSTAPSIDPNIAPPTTSNPTPAPTSVPPVGSTLTELIVFIGESNASGIAPNSAATSNEQGPRPLVKILNNYSFQFETLDLGVNNNIDNATPWNESHSWEVGLANAVDAGRLRGPVYLVKAAASGTRIDQWLKDGGGTWWENMRKKLDSAIAELNRKQIPYRITVWYSLGLNDALQGTPSAVFRTRIEQFFRDFRATYGAQTPIYMTRFHEYADSPGDGLGHPYNPTIDAIGAADPHTVIIASQGATFNPGERFVHWGYEGMKTLANRFIDQMLTDRASSIGHESVQATPQFCQI